MEIVINQSVGWLVLTKSNPEKTHHMTLSTTAGEGVIQKIEKISLQTIVPM